MKITDSRANDILHWLDDETGNHALLFEKMTLHRDAAALIRQLQAADRTNESRLRAATVLIRDLDAAEQAAWHAGLDAGREQGRGKDHAHPSPSVPVGVEAQVSALQSVRDRMMAALTPKFGDAFDGDFDVMLEAINTMKRFRIVTLAQQPAAVDAQ